MNVGFIGLGRMGTNMVRRLMKAGHRCVVYNRHPEAVQALVKEGAVGATSLEDFANKLKSPRTIWLMVPAAVVDPRAVVEGSVVGPGCRIEAGAHVHGSVILAGALVAAGMTMDNLVVGRTGEPVW